MDTSMNKDSLSLRLPGAIVTNDWLAQHLGHPDLIVLDASIPPISGGSNVPEGVRISGARFFDINHKFSDTSVDLPHMMAHPEQFTREARLLGIKRNSVIIVYDKTGVYSSPRAWWMLRSMGHGAVAVLDGGLPAWIAAGFPTEEVQDEKYLSGDFEAHFQSDFFVGAADVLSNIENPEHALIDARSRGRFAGMEPEPRAGLRGGHIPHSQNLPFPDLTREYHLIPVEELRQKFGPLNLTGKQLTFTCGSGLTACILALGAHLIGHEEVSVYDGSWSEWGQPGNLPIVDGEV